jgi:hypothetical protein
MWDRLRGRSDRDDSVLAVVDKGGVLIAGAPGTLDTVIARLTSVGGTRSHRIVADPAAAVASGLAASNTHRQYVALSPESLKLLRQHGAVPGDQGFFRMFVHDGKHIAGQLQWAKVDVLPEQALSLQVSAVSLALRAVILEVQQSLERVESKLDHLTRLLRAERLGDALGDHRTLTHLARRVRTTNRFSAADWTTVANVGPEIGRDLETLRAHIRSLLDKVDPGFTTWSRAEEALELVEEDWLAESLALLAIVEHNFALWQELRIAHVNANERAHLAETVEDARSQIDIQREADQQLLGALSARAAEVTDPHLLDGLDPLNARRLERVRDELDRLVMAFADQRLLDATSFRSSPFPGFGESVQQLARLAGRTAVHLTSGIRSAVRRSRKNDPPSLPPGPDEPDPPAG